MKFVLYKIVKTLPSLAKPKAKFSTSDGDNCSLMLLKISPNYMDIYTERELRERERERVKKKKEWLPNCISDMNPSDLINSYYVSDEN